ncbi:hypothetical protein BD414DRAFT_540590 [Trametes punicea]|nr:hypothetical protein BD414DRAFT_540590 [Trametes punicea]
MSLGYTAFAVFSRNSAEVNAHLLKVSGAVQLYVSSDGGMQTLSRNAIDMLGNKAIEVELVPMITPEEYASPSTTRFAYQLVDITDDEATSILHSSVPVTCFGEVDLAGERIAAHTNHAMGFATMIEQTPALSSGTVDSVDSLPAEPRSLYAPTLPLTVPIPANFLEAWVACKCNNIICVPVFIDRLPPNSTEVGPATMFIRRDPPPVDEWEYFKLSKHLTFHMQPQEGLERIYGPIMINRWKVFGRKDDQIILSTGENINPLPMEGMLVHDPHIALAIILGRHRIEPRVLVGPASGFSISPGDSQQLEEPTIEKAKAGFPAYANIKRNMILVTNSKKPLEYTAKGTPRRGVCLKLYEEEIVYACVEDAPPDNRQYPDRM